MMAHPRRRWSARWYLALGSATLVALIAGFGVWAALAQISGAIVAPGQIEVAQNKQIIQHPDGGVVAAIHVREGDTVAAGDLLLRLDASALQSEMAIVEAELFNVLALRARLEAERDDATALVFSNPLREVATPEAKALMAGQERLFAAVRETERGAVEQLRQRLAQITSQRRGITAQKDALVTQRALVAAELRDQQNLLDRGLAQTRRVLALQREDATLLGSMGQLTAQDAQAAERAAEINLQILALSTARRQKAAAQLHDLQVKHAVLSERHRALQRQYERLEIRAPVAGVVHGLRVFAAQTVIGPAEPVLYLIPQDRALVMTTRIAIFDIDKVHVGQTVTLRLPAFDQSRTPELLGHVARVSADIFQSDTAGPHYRAEVHLPPGEAARLPADMTLIPGMPVEAFIKTSDRSPLTYLVKPVSDYFARAFREP